MVVHREFREDTNNAGHVVAEGFGKEIIRRIVERGTRIRFIPSGPNDAGPLSRITRIPTLLVTSHWI